MSKKNIYFFSDFHLGMPPGQSSISREKKIVSILKDISSDAHSIFLLGDIFDFWFEYKEVVPKGYFRLLNTIAELTEQKISIYIFPGNHDLWINDYIEKYCGAIVLREPQEFYYGNKKFHIHHGDGLGPGDRKYKFLKRIFQNKTSNFLFRWLHPDIGVSIARWLSSKSRLAQGITGDSYLGDDKEYLTQYCNDVLKTKNSKNNPDYEEDKLIFLENDDDVVNYFVFGHRHLLLDIKLTEHSRYVNLGHWLTMSNYGVFDGSDFRMISLS